MHKKYTAAKQGNATSMADSYVHVSISKLQLHLTCVDLCLV